MISDNTAIVRRLFEAFNANELTAASLLFRDDYVRHGSSGQNVNGREEWAEMVRGYRAAFPDVVTDIDRLVAQDDHVTTLRTSRGTHKGSLTASSRLVAS